MKLTFLNFLIYSLAVYRLAVLLGEDTGPYKLASRFRSWLKREAKRHPVFSKSDVHHGIECLRCSSIWVAIPVAAFAYFRDSLLFGLMVTGDVFLLCMAVSAAAILWGRTK